MRLQHLAENMLADGYSDTDVRESVAVYLDSVGYEVTHITYVCIDRAIERAKTQLKEVFHVTY